MSEKSSEDIKSEIAQLKETVNNLTNNLKPLKDKLREVVLAENNLRAQFSKIILEKNQLSAEIEKAKRLVQSAPNKLANLENELNTITENEEIAKKLEQELEIFKERCLNASWRKENREDGKGAMQHQIDGAISLAAARMGYLFDRTGLGKTLTSIAWSDLCDISKLLIITPNESASQFMRELTRWTPHRQIIPFVQQSPSERKMWTETIIPNLSQWTVVTNFQSWRKDYSVIDQLIKLQPNGIIVDEAHNANKTKTKQWRGIFDIRTQPNICPECRGSDIEFDTNRFVVICRKCGESERRYGVGDFYSQEALARWNSVENILLMTGTPILNRPQEFYAIGKLVEPWRFTSESSFLSNYCTVNSDKRWTFRYGGQDALMKRIGKRVVSRDRKSAGVIIPPQEVKIYELEFDSEEYPEQAKAIQQLEQYAQLVLSEEGEDVLSATEIITLLLRLRQCMVWPAGIKLVRKDEKGRIVFERNLEVYQSIKMDWVQEKLKELTEENERVVVFSQFKEPLRELARRLDSMNITNATLDGDTPHWKREEIKNDFNPDICSEINYRWKVFLGNYKAAGEALNLQAATQMILMDEEWSHGKESQAMGRINRIGTTEETTVHIPRVIGTVDMWLAKLISQKAEMAQGFDSAAELRNALIQGINHN